MIKSAKFIVSATTAKQWEEYREANRVQGSPLVAMVGRSNVGKSSLINMLTNQKGLAITSSTPGRTRLINFFQIKLEAGEMYLVDLPGYGFAKASKSMQGGWGVNIEEFLLSGLQHVFVLVDIRIPPSDYDKQMIIFLQMNSIPFKIVATKGDKLSKAQLTRAIQIYANAMGITMNDVIATSAKTGMGKDKIDKVLVSVLQ